MNTTKTSKKTVTIFGDVLEIHYDGTMWVSPYNGQQHSRAEHAMRSELEAYYASSGSDIEDEWVSNEIAGHVLEMAD